MSSPDAERSAPAPGEVRRPGTGRRALQGTKDFLRRTYEKAGEDNIFFLAGAIAFNIMVAFVPLVLAVLGIAGTVLRMQGVDSTALVIEYLQDTIPAISVGLAEQDTVAGVLEALIEQSAGLLGIGTLVLAWVATRLIATLRTVLRDIFDIHYDRGVVAGKLFDLKMVLAAGTLFTISVGGSALLQIVANRGFQAIGLQYGFPQGAQLLFGHFITILILWVMFLLIYRYLPARTVSWRTGIIAASVTTVLFELLKRGFTWYATNVADYGSTYGSFAFIIILILWIYYSSVVFILGGEIAQVVMMGRTRRRQKERLG